MAALGLYTTLKDYGVSFVNLVSKPRAATEGHPYSTLYIALCDLGSYSRQEICSGGGEDDEW